MKKSWDGMTNQQKRVAIAEDILLNLKNKVIVAKKGRYIDINTRALGVDEDDDVKENFGKIKNCPVCMMGACLLSVVKMENNANFDDMAIGIDSADKMWERLNEYFPKDSLLLIESAFEKSTGGLRVAEDRFHFKSEILANMGVKWGKKYSTDNKRIVAICKNIIKNKGEFIPYKI